MGFFTEFLKDRKMVGSITPSSKALVKHLTKHFDFDKAKVIVELGPGNGCVTRELLRRMKPGTRLVTIELNKPFCERLEKYGDSRMTVVNDSAHRLTEILHNLGLGQADYVVSSLPLTNIPTKIRIAILNEVVRNLAPSGIFTQFQYYTTAEKLIRKKFRHVRINFTPLNVPPAFIYVCRH